MRLQVVIQPAHQGLQAGWCVREGRRVLVRVVDVHAHQRREQERRAGEVSLDVAQVLQQPRDLLEVVAACYAVPANHPVRVFQRGGRLELVGGPVADLVCVRPQAAFDARRDVDAAFACVLDGHAVRIPVHLVLVGAMAVKEGAQLVDVVLGFPALDGFHDHQQVGIELAARARLDDGAVGP
ncbi:hypothetical protein D3C78_718440 [compost metagenome]